MTQPAVSELETQESQGWGHNSVQVQTPKTQEPQCPGSAGGCPGSRRENSPSIAFLLLRVPDRWDAAARSLVSGAGLAGPLPECVLQLPGLPCVQQLDM